MADLRAQLQEGLGTSYTLERDLRAAGERESVMVDLRSPRVDG